MNNSIQIKKTTFKNNDGFTIYEHSRLLKEPKGVVLICHGIAEHSGRYEHVAESLCKAEYSVVSFDLRGHGKSSGKRAYVNRFSDYLNDLGEVLDRVKINFPEQPIFLMGHSMGGGIIALFVIERETFVNGIILSAPTAKVSEDLSPFLQKISGILSAIVPKLPTIKLDNSFRSKDPEVAEAFDADPLNYKKGIIARTGTELLRSAKAISQGCAAIDLPILIMHGTIDKLADISGSEMLYDRVSSSDKTIKLYEGLHHEILNEPEKDQVEADIISWLNERI